MLRSLYSGVSGMKSQLTKFDVIGNNIANVSTYGFKSSNTTFRDVYYQTLSSASNANGNMGGTNASQVGYGATVSSINLLNTRAGFASTGRPMDCYIDGEGYFVIKDGAGNERLSQIGTLGFDGAGNLIDGNSNFVCGYSNPTLTGKASVGTATINFGTDNNVGKSPTGDPIMDGYTVEVKYNPAATDTSTTIAADADKKTITVTFTPNATTTSLTKEGLYTALKDNTKWTWPASGTGAKPAGFDESKITLDGIDPAATDTTQSPYTDVVPETSGMVAQVPSFDYSKTPEKIVNTFGELTNMSIGADGIITGQANDGSIKVIGQIAIANVPNPDALTLEGNSYYKAINNTGAITYSAPGDNNVGKLKTGGLESSNVDISNEFSDMIMTQRAFQANSKIITVSDEMLDTLVNLKR